jgi:hypothetical protein
MHSIPIYVGCFPCLIGVGMYLLYVFKYLQRVLVQAPIVNILATYNLYTIFKWGAFLLI